MKGDNFSPKEKATIKPKTTKDGELNLNANKAVASPPLNKEDATAERSKKIKPIKKEPFEKQGSFSSMDSDGSSSRIDKPDVIKEPIEKPSKLSFEKSAFTSEPKEKSKKVDLQKKLVFEKSEPVEHSYSSTPKLTDRQSNRLKKLKKKEDKAEKNYFDKESKLPTQKRLVLTKKNEDGKRKLKFEDTVTSKEKALKTLEPPKIAQALGGVATGAVSSALEGSGGKTSQEQDTRKVVDKTVETVDKTVKTVLNIPQNVKAHKYKAFEKAEAKAVKMGGKHDYKKFRFERQALHKVDPLGTSKLKSNPISRHNQKKSFMANFRKKLKECSKKVAHGITGVAKLALKIVLGRIKKISIVIVAIMLIAFSVSSCMQGIGLSATGIMKGIFSTTYPADDEQLSSADWYFSDLEAGLQDSVLNAEKNNPNHDEYRYYLNGELTTRDTLIFAVGHDPFALYNVFRSIKATYSLS